jgi:hypothetical protein
MDNNKQTNKKAAAAVREDWSTFISLTLSPVSV